ncbi:thiolase family protein [Streptomyces sp. NPDC055078]
MTDIYVLGAGMAPFGKHPLGSAPRLVREAGLAALADAGCTFADIGTVFTGSCHPASPRGVYVMKELGVTGTPLQHVENASASGLAAIHAAAHAIRAGEAEIALVVGFDAPDFPMEVQDVVDREGHIPPVALFAMWAHRRMHEAGTRPEHFAAIAAKNWNYARDNPYAARRAAEPVTVEQVLASRVVATPLHSMMSTAWGDGAAAVVLGTAEAMRRFAKPGRPAVRLAASQLQSETYTPGHVFAGAIVGPPEMTRSTARAAYEQAGVGPGDLDTVQVHDAFAVEELVYAELLGLCRDGEAEYWLDKGAFGPGSRQRLGKPEMSTDGGLIARGHPGGPTGVAQVWETVRRLRLGDRLGLCQMLGAGSVCFVQVYEKVDAS